MRSMAEVPSTFTLKAGDKAPEFTLPDGTGKEFALKDLLGKKATLVMFVCNHCPFVVHLAKQVGEMAAEMKSWGVNTVAISSNDVENYPQDAPEKMVEFADEYAWGFPYLYDASQSVAHAYHAACTPDFFLLDKDGCLFYAGQYDNSRPNNKELIDGRDLKLAIRQLLEDGAPILDTKPATGCNIKWKPGNEPSYFG